ncbi:MAG: short-chain dehydrogenase/reductase [Sphingobacteriales bacterium]|nr:short-chain dehydrogenase/reductase [Sphingobacteriales bacterium]
MMNAVVTGGTKGMGRAIINLLAANQFNIAFCARNIDELDSLKSELESAYPDQTFFCLQTDCAIQNEVENFASFALENFQSVDVLVNNAGIFIPSLLFDEQENILQKQMSINVYAPYLFSKILGKKMIEAKHGHIFNICSVASLNPVKNAASYSVTKIALLGLTKVLREELMQHHVKVTAILPGSTLTDSWEGTDISAERFVSADDVAKAILTCLKMSIGANVDEIIIRPVLGEI